MKYLKKYEKLKKDEIVFYIPYNDPTLIRVAIDKILTINKIPPLKNINALFDSIDLSDDNRDEIRGIFFGLYKDDNWEYEFIIDGDDDDNYEYNLNIFIEDNYKFGGNIELEDWEISAGKYNL